MYLDKYDQKIAGAINEPAPEVPQTPPGKRGKEKIVAAE
jgi:hypothetical protein